MPCSACQGIVPVVDPAGHAHPLASLIRAATGPFRFTHNNPIAKLPVLRGPDNRHGCA